MKSKEDKNTLQLDFEGTGVNLSLEGRRLMKFKELEDKVFLVGSYHYSVRKPQFDWIEGRTSTDHQKRYNIRLNTTNRNGVRGFDFLSKEVSYIILYEAGTVRIKAPKIYSVKDCHVYDEKRMRELGYPSPTGDYLVYDLSSEVFFEHIKLASVLSFYKNNLGEEWVENMPLFLTGHQIDASYTRKVKRAKFQFIDLFAGLGGFHLALESIGGQCVFASEIKADLRKQYVLNYGLEKKFLNDDITKLNSETAILDQVPPHDVLCAGFPCQPFSKAGKRQGFNDEEGRGVLFNYIEAIVRVRRPKYIFLENVSNLESHDNGNTWNTIRERLQALEYEVDKRILSPHQFGYPQHRKRIYIVGADIRAGYNLNHFSFPDPTNAPCDITRLIDDNAKYYIPISSEQRLHLEQWERFLHICAKHQIIVPKFPIWTMEWGADYEYTQVAPAYQSLADLQGKHGHLGNIINGKSLEQCLAQLPNYSQTNKSKKFPEWKIRYIRQNRLFYEQNKKWLDSWLNDMRSWENSFLKFEWNCPPDAAYTLEDKLIQFRASGIRVKAATFTPSLNLVKSQIPIIPWVELPPDTVPPNKPSKGRYMTIREAAKLQGMEGLDFSLLLPNRVYEALGNAVNVQVVKNIAKRLIKINNHE